MSQKARYSFAVIAHTPELLECVRRCVDADRYDVVYKEVERETAISVARECLKEGAEAVICHGGAQNSILRAIGGSVITIGRTDIDIINTMKQASLLSKSIAYASWIDEAQNIATLEKILDIKLYHTISDNYDLMRANIQKFYDQGVRVLVGAGVSKKIMETCGGIGFAVIPNEYRITKALEQAAEYARQKRAVLSNAKNLFTMLDQLEEAAVCIDDKGALSFVTSKALDFLRLSGESWEQAQKFSHALQLPETLHDRTPRKNVVTEIGNEQFLVSTIPFTTDMGKGGAMALFRDASSVQQMNRKIGEAKYSKSFTCRYTASDILGSSAAISDLKGTIARFAPTDAAVLIHGETGTGKELVAHALHAHSARHSSPFVAVNCAAMPKNLMESELFGYEGGAFTGAQRGGKPGLFELAHKGTLFLDEIGEMSHEMQLRLLRVLEAKEVMRLGARRVLPVDVRILCASHQSLLDLMGGNTFRQDLYYRISTLKLTVPPLRSRTEDIDALVARVVKKYNKTMRIFSGKIMARMKEYGWPGNIRELLAIVESYCLLLQSADADEGLFHRLLSENSAPAQEKTALYRPGMLLRDVVEAAKADAISHALRAHGGDKYLAAKSLGISYPTLWRCMQQNSVDSV